MANIKIAIFLHKALFDQVETLARDMKVSCSRLFVMAAQDYIRRQQNLQLLEKINHACSAMPDTTEQNRLRQMYRVQRKIVESQLSEHIGTLSKKRVRQILDGLRLITEPREIE